MSTRRGLVLGGGGITGIAWETGLLWGLAERGIDLTAADRVVGTSAGSIVGAQILGGPTLEKLYQEQLLSPAELGDGDVPLPDFGLRFLLSVAPAVLLSRGNVERFGRLLGRSAVFAASRPSIPTIGERYEQIDKRIHGLDWPKRDFIVTAVDARTGALAMFGPQTSRAEVSLEDAVNASCAVPLVYPPIPIAGRPYVDGGIRSGSNADLMSGMDRVVALTPSDRSIGPLRNASQQLSELAIEHVVITPDKESVRAIGPNLLDPGHRPGSARAGYAQAAREAERIRRIWMS